MTTVSIKNGFMCADSRVTQGSRILGTVSKLHKRKKHVIGTAGSLTAISKFLEWFDNGSDIEDFPEADEKDSDGFEALVYDRVSKTIKHYCDSPVENVITAECFSIGTGSSYALGAMGQGATAYESIRVASKFDIYTDDNVETVML